MVAGRGSSAEGLTYCLCPKPVPVSTHCLLPPRPSTAPHGPPPPAAVAPEPRTVRAATQLCVAAAGMARGWCGSEEGIGEGRLLKRSVASWSASQTRQHNLRSPLHPAVLSGLPPPRTTVHTNIPSRSRLIITGAHPSPEVHMAASSDTRKIISNNRSEFTPWLLRCPLRLNLLPHATQLPAREHSVLPHPRRHRPPGACLHPSQLSYLARHRLAQKKRD